jgi:hypothetical protein
MVRASVRGKFIGYFRLVEACAGPECPVCHCLAADGRHHIETIVYEHVNDLDVRRSLRAAWGLCNWHTGMLRALGGAATGAAILDEDLLRLAARRVARLRDRRPVTLGRWVRRRGPRLVELFRRRARCPVCRTSRDAEARYVETVVDFVDDPEFAAAYARSPGLCVAHVMQATERRPGTPALTRLLDDTLDKWETLRRRLEGFVRKHDHRSAEPISEADAAACATASGLLAGAPGVFGNDLH